jgi:hypothetical protein
MLFAITRSNLLIQIPNLNQIIQQLKETSYRKRFNGNIFMEIALNRMRYVMPIVTEGALIFRSVSRLEINILWLGFWIKH